MSRLPVTLLTVVTAVAAVVAILSDEPGEVASAAAMNQILANDPTAARLNARTYEIGARISYKESLIRDLVAGRATLAQVTDEFLRLNEEEPAAMAVIRDRYPGSGDEEKSANNVIGFVRQRRLPADEEARVLDRLGTEFVDRFGHPPSTIP